MKRILCFILCVVMISLFAAPSIFADGDAHTNEKMPTFDNAVSFTCEYDANQSQILINGTVSHDFLINNENYTIKVFSILPGVPYSSIIDGEHAKECVKADMSVRFTFHIEAKSILERFSQYAIVLCSPEGKNYLAGKPILPSISSSFEYNGEDRSHFKGILTESSVNIGASGAGTAIVDVNIGQMLGDSSDSILYPMKDSYVHIKKSYIEQIDKKVQAATLKGTDVYVRLLISANNSELGIADSADEGKYTVPNLYAENVLEYVYTAVSFLAQRYSEQNARIRGMIVGTRIDDVEDTNDIGNMGIEEYSKLYTTYLVVVCNATRALDSQFDIVIPLSDTNSYMTQELTGKRMLPDELLEAIVELLDSNVSGRFDCSAMIETDLSPLGITNQSIGDGIDVNRPSNTDRLCANNIDVFIDYINALSTRLESVPSSVIYLWNVDPSLNGNALSCAYVYNYLKLISNESVSSFVVSLDSEAFSGLRTVIRYIDTSRAESTVAPLAKYFGATNWGEIVGTVNLPVFKTVFEEQFTTSKHAGTLGEFTYVDFSVSSTVEAVRAGERCESFRLDHDSHGTRALRAISSPLTLGDCFEIVEAFPLVDSFIYTPQMSLRIGVDDPTASDNALYEIALTVGNQTGESVICGVIRNHETKDMYFDISVFASEFLTEHIKISVRPLSSASESISVWLYDIKGYSTEYDSDTLKTLIEQKRMEIRNENDDNHGGFNYTVIITIVGIVLAMAAVALGLLIVFRRDEENSQS